LDLRAPVVGSGIGFKLDSVAEVSSAASPVSSAASPVESPFGAKVCSAAPFAGVGDPAADCAADPVAPGVDSKPCTVDPGVPTVAGGVTIGDVIGAADE
jgi:hypothetical protein